MNILDFVETWVISVRETLEAAGVAISFTRTTDSRPKHGCSLNLQKGIEVVDLLVWDSGEADLELGEVLGPVTQKHFNDIRDPKEFGGVLALIIKKILAAKAASKGA